MLSNLATDRLPPSLPSELDDSAAFFDFNTEIGVRFGSTEDRTGFFLSLRLSLTTSDEFDDSSSSSSSSKDEDDSACSSLLEVLKSDEFPPSAALNSGSHGSFDLTEAPFPVNKSYLRI